MYQGRGTSGRVLLSGDGDFDTYTKEGLFGIGNPPQPVAPPTPVPPPVQPPGTPFISVVLELDFGPEHLAWGLKAADDTYVDYRSTNSFKDIPQGTITETVHLISEDVPLLPEYDFTMYNVNGGWVGAYAVYMGPVNTGRLLFEGDGQFVNGRTLERHSFAVLESDYDTFGWNLPSPTTTGGVEVDAPTTLDTNGQQDGDVDESTTSPAAKSLGDRNCILSSLLVVVVFGASLC